MSQVKDYSVEEKLSSLVKLQKVDSKLDGIQILKGELPIEVSDLEDEIEGLHARQNRIEEEINGMQQFIEDKKTIINLTNHTYFNLNGVDSDLGILNHILEIDADKIVEVNETCVATGEFLPVNHTPFDFRKPTEIGDRIKENHEQLQIGNGYDHTFVFNKKDGALENVASVYSPETGINMNVITNEPGMQLYTGNYLNGKDADGKNGNTHPFRYGFCLETQHFPDSPNHSNFPSTVLNVGEVYESMTIYEFEIQDQI